MSLLDSVADTQPSGALPTDASAAAGSKELPPQPLLAAALADAPRPARQRVQRERARFIVGCTSDSDGADDTDDTDYVNTDGLLFNGAGSVRSMEHRSASLRGANGPDRSDAASAQGCQTLGADGSPRDEPGGEPSKVRRRYLCAAATATATRVAYARHDTPMPAGGRYSDRAVVGTSCRST